MSHSPLTITDLYAARSRDFRLHIAALELQAGTITCIVGPNGSGKTTLIECIVGLLRPQKGTVLLDGQAIDNNLKRLKNILGYIPDDEAWFVKELCAQEYFELLTKIYQDAGVTANMQSNVHSLMTQLNFTQQTTALEQLSHGNKKKVQIIAGLMHEPKLIVIDELRNGLDPLAIMTAERIIKQRAKAGACIVAATHDLWWAQRLASNIMVISNGDVKLAATTKTIIKKYGSLEALFIELTKNTRDDSL